MTAPRNRWAEVRDAITAAIMQASGLDDQHVLWTSQNRNQPTLPYIDLSLSGAENPGQDGVVSSTDLSRPAGQEILLETIGFREVVLGIEVFTETLVESPDEGHDALEIAEQIRSSMILPGLRDRLSEFGVSPLDLSNPVQYLPTIVSVGFRGRATYDIRLNVPAVVAVEYTGFIEKVNGTETIHGAQVDPLVRTFTAP